MIKRRRYNILQNLIFFLLFSCILFSQSKFSPPEWSYNKTIYEVNIRQYTPSGTFNEFRKHLPELKELGAGILWLMPIHPIGEKNRKGSMGSYYAVKDYLDVNPEFGSKEDLRDLVKVVHSLGMYIIIDWVANHTSWDSKLAIVNPDWFTKDSLGNFILPDPAWSDVIDLNFDNHALRNYMTGAMEYWIKEFDIDGYRCDVAELVPLDFWISAREELQKIKPVFMLAEGEKPELYQAFDMTYTWGLFRIMNDIAAGTKSTKDLTKFFEEDKKNYPADAFRMRFITNHDENSWNGTEFERLKEGAEAFGVLISLVPGMPLLYTGQETALNKRLKFFDKDTIDWKPHKLRSIFSSLFNLKLENKALYNGIKGGAIQVISSQDDSLSPAFIREKNSDKVSAVFNFSGKERTILIKNNLLKGTYINLFTVKINI